MGDDSDKSKGKWSIDLDFGAVAWALVIGLWVILFAGEPDIQDAIICWLMR